MPLFAASRRYLLHMAARAWPGAADGSKWLLEPAPEPQMSRNGRSSPPRSRKYLKSAARVCPGAAECSTCAARVCPGTAECSTSAARATPEAQNVDGCLSSLPRSHSMLEKCRSSPQPRGASVSCVRKGRSKRAGPCSSFIGISFCSAPLCFVHVMHGFTLVCIYIYMYIY